MPTMIYCITVTVVTTLLVVLVNAHPASVIRQNNVPGGDVETDANVELLLPDMMASMAAYDALQASPVFRADSATVCYPDLGCFSRVGNFSNFGRLPLAPTYLKTGFHLFTMENQTDGEALNYSNPLSVSSSNFRAGEQTFVVMHGFGESGRADWIVKFQTAILRKFPNANFIAVDWAVGAKQPDYWQAAANTQMIGAQIAKLLSVINQVTGTLMSQVHLIGFSLGAQVAGLTSEKLVEFGLSRVGRITGLDPAGPVFENAHSAGRLDEEDADFVQAIHGNGATLLQGAFGINRRVAHRDYYPNGGQFQPGCPQGLWGSVSGSIWNMGDIFGTVACNHFRAIAYALESFEPSCRFTSLPCASYASFLKGECSNQEAVHLDIFAEKSHSEKPLYLMTNSEPGFCTNALKVVLTISDNYPRKGALVLKLKSRLAPPTSSATTYTILKETQFLTGSAFQEIIPSRLRLEELEEASIEYQRSCVPLFCGSNTQLNVTSFEIQELSPGGLWRSSCTNVHLPYAQVVTVVMKDQASCSLI